MLSESFELKVGLLGYVSVGKTTGLNALLQQKYGEVSMKRTTAGINMFRLSSLSKSPKRTKRSPTKRKTARSTVEDPMDCQDSMSTASESEASDDSSCIRASDALLEIAADNAKLRKSNEIQEKMFDIALDEPLLQDMRDDTRIVLVDIPGINEAGSSNVYLDYVEKTWDTYDAMIVVMVRVKNTFCRTNPKRLTVTYQQCKPGCSSRCQHG